MDVEPASTSGAGGAALLGVAIALYARDQVNQIVPAAQCEGELGDVAVIDHRAECGIVRRKLDRGRLHFDCCADLTDCQREIAARFLGGLERHLLDGSLESGLLRGHFIVANGERRERIIARSVCLHRTADARPREGPPVRRDLCRQG